MCNISVHPIYSHYEFDRNGIYRLVGTETWLSGKPISSGYYIIYLKGNGSLKGTTKFLHRAVWEAFYGTIAPGMEIDHINKSPSINSLSNLRCLTISEHKKTRDHSFIHKMVAERKQNERKIKSVNLQTTEEKIFSNKTRTARYFGCSPALIYAVCEGRCKTLGGTISFAYTDEEITQHVPRKKHICKYNTDEERTEARKRYIATWKAKQKEKVEKIEKIETI